MKTSPAFASLLLAGLAGSAAAAPALADERPGEPRHGKLVYERYCVSCHGDLGNGQGEFAQYITPRPRDYRQGTFKWRSTPSGALPTVADLEKTIKDGVYGTYMPTWFPIGHRQRLDVIAYIQQFSDRWKTEKPEPAIEIPPEPPNDNASIEKGRKLYVALKCAQCHGDQAQGDGVSAHELKDDWGQPIEPADLTIAPRYKCGDTPRDVYRVFMTGLNGTPMPTFVQLISKEDAWDLAHFIWSLRPGGPNHPQPPALGRK
jgi:mono/diheme cytochrome c family protein